LPHVLASFKLRGQWQQRTIQYGRFLVSGKTKNHETGNTLSAIGAPTHHFPDGSFAFTIVDDTDFSSVENVKPVYELLLDLGFRTTKTVWPLAGALPNHGYGSSLEEPAYRRFAQDLQRNGVEMALHNVQHGTATRERTLHGLEAFAGHFGHMPSLQCNHETNRENLYWGSARLRNGARRRMYNATMLLETADRESAGHVDGSAFFWGDLCRQHVRYVRNLVFREINLDSINPSMPYHETSKPWVNRWFSACDGEDVERFCRLISERNQDRLEAEQGVCIVYTHLAYGFFDHGRVQPEFERLLRRLAAKKGWFVPASEMLDHLALERRSATIPEAEIDAMEGRWFKDRLRRKVEAAMAFKAHSWDRFRSAARAGRAAPKNGDSVGELKPEAAPSATVLQKAGGMKASCDQGRKILKTESL